MLLNRSSAIPTVRRNWRLAGSVPGILRPGIDLAVLALLATSVASTPAVASDDVESLWRKLNERIDQVEQRNRVLEQEVRSLRARTGAGSAAAASAVAGPVPPVEGTRLDKLERENAALQQQMRDLAAAPQPELVIPEPGFEIGGSFIGLFQRANRRGVEPDGKTNAVNYRGDIEISLPAGSIGDAQGKAFAHVRLGQGDGLELRPTLIGVQNSTTFQKASYGDLTPEDSFAVLAQAWYQVTWPLSATRFNDLPGDRVEFTIGKMDFFAFFDQNDVAGNEASQFINNAFLHNALLDAGGDIGADTYAFAPGARLAYFNEGDGSYRWGASFGVFESGDGANFAGRLGKGPLTIAQVEYSPRQINGEPRGNYRAYAWTNGNTVDIEGIAQRHSGWGVSIDQKIGRNWNVFGRYGKRTKGDGPFDSVLAVGGELSGRAWGRRHDVIGLGLGLLETSSAFRRATADGTSLGYRADGAERLAELYYRYRFNDRLEVSPHLQWIGRPGGDEDAPSVRILGLRATLSF